MLTSHRSVRAGVFVTAASLASCGPATVDPGNMGTSTVAAPDLAPVAGGTLLVSRDGSHIVASDPDRDRVWIVTRGNRTPVSVALEAHAEPGRLVEDGAGMVHVVLRRAGRLVTVDPSDGHVVATRDVCAAPRGLAYDRDADLLHVACTDGHLVSLHTTGSDVVRDVMVARDLRDVLVTAQGLAVTTFRSARVMHLDAQGEIRTTARIEDAPLVSSAPAVAQVAWRAIVSHGGDATLVHQYAEISTRGAAPVYYGESNDTAVVGTAVTQVRGGNAHHPQATAVGAVVPVDVAISADDATLAIASAGTSEVHFVHFADTTSGGAVPSPAASAVLAVSGMPVGVAYDPDGSLWVQTRAPGALLHTGANGRTIATTIALQVDGVPEPANEGHAIFHKATVAFVACASCHPEGGDDGHVWNFGDVGVRRTQSIRGGLMATAPFHWDGSLADVTAIVHATFETRMHGAELSPLQVSSLGQWLDSIPAVANTATSAMTTDHVASIARGRALFESADVGCAACHGGAAFTNNSTVDVGTGGAFQVPSLRGVVHRAPFLHTGCAATLYDRFGTCGGGDLHGHTSQLAQADVSDLVAYLETL